MKIKECLRLFEELIEPPWMYTCWRIGENGEQFWCYKFRTMVVEADKNKPTHTVRYKDEHDKRILVSRQWMRRIGFDEVPQLYNILKRDMNLFGARPVVKSDWDQLTSGQKQRRLAHKPGCFGPYAMLRDGKNDNNLLMANDAYLRILYKKRGDGKVAVLIFKCFVFLLTLKAIVEGKVK